MELINALEKKDFEDFKEILLRGTNDVNRSNEIRQSELGYYSERPLLVALKKLEFRPLTHLQYFRRFQIHPLFGGVHQ